MGKVLSRELLLVLATGLFGWLAVPALLGQPPALAFLLVGLFLALTFTPMHALSLMAGRRLSPTWRMWAGIFAWVFAFLSQLIGVLAVRVGGQTMTPSTMAMELVPALLGLLLALLAGLRTPAGSRGHAAAWALFLYSLPMWVVRDVLVRFVSPNLMLMLTAMLGGALYMFLHGLLRIFLPTPAEDDTRLEPLVRRPVPDAIVGLVEGTLHRRARPYATTDQGLDDTAISVLCEHGEVAEVVDKLSQALGGRPFAATPGQTVKGKVEIVIRAKG